MSGMFRLPDQAALDAMLKRTHVRVVRPMEVKKPDAPPVVAKPPVVRKKTLRKRKRIDYVGVLIRQMLRANLPEAKREFKFLGNRRFGIDLAYPDIKLAIEVDGMAHRIKDRFLRDIEKSNELTFHGWRLVRIYTRWIANEKCEFSVGIELVKRALGVAE